ncbi:inositol-pentakisphosphate 2-kinase-like isoform X2 [Corylus avellana]|nr:inositol-pentakisphosphate 2-kinase-like isoform X2 [Corylus avellana]XP_059460196.1 inositol-pentakisphosphate 2-kinase-like isoform X2 [Corylus avellana]
MEEEVFLEHKDAADWVYRGEGAANLVLAYTGSSPFFVGKVMRIRKAARNKTARVRSPTALSTHERLLWRDIDDIVSSHNKEIAAQLYVQRVMSPLLGPKHVDAGMRVHVSREFLESAEKNVIYQRPAWRVDAAKVDMQCDSTLLITDHSLFGGLKGEPCISVEIKPKCGFLPFSKFISEGNAIKRSISRFRMHQTLKLRQGEVSKLSKYNPLDLFSKSKDRIHKAISDLFTTPQNNFRVFLNGSLIFGGLGGGADSTNFVISEAFEDALKSVIRADNGLRTRNFLQLVSETVYKSGVLDRLLEVQKLDNLDIEGAVHAYYDIISESCPVCRELGGDEVSHIYTSLHSISLDERLKIVKDFLTAATAKDCSLMVSFRPREDKGSGSSYNKVYLESANQNFEYKVSFIDLDLKPLKKMEKYYELDKKIVNCYTQMLETDQEVDEATSMEAYTTIKDSI